jgi:hypothetical protein
MKLQLTPSETRIYAAKVGASTGALRQDADRVLEIFAAEGHDPITRRDITSVVEALGHSMESDAWAIIGESISANCTSSGKRGYYTQGDRVGTPASASAAVADLIESGAMEVVTKSGLSWLPTVPTVPSEQEGYYSDDEGLRRLAATNVRCFGFYAETDKSCKVCPLARFCAQSSMASIAAIVSRLDTETEEALARVAAAAAAPPSASEDEASDESSEAEASVAARATVGPEAPLADRMNAKYGDGGWEEVTLPFDGVCSASGCSKAILEEANAIHVAGVGMFHPDCA